MRFLVAGLRRARASPAERMLRLDGAQHAMRHRPLRPLPARPDARLPRRAGLPLVGARAVARDQGAVTVSADKKTARRVEVRLLRRLPAQPARLRGRAARARRRNSRSPTSSRPRARPSTAPTTSRWSRARSPRRTTPSGSRRCAPQSRALITIGACATAGGIQALRNFADVEEFTRIVYATPDYISTLATSTPISAHVPVDFELQGCPINKQQLLEVISAYLNGRRPRIRAHSVCVECKRRGTVCVMVAHGTPCLGPVTHAGCGAICPSYDRGCYGCYGPKETPNTASLNAWSGARGPRPGARVPHVQRARRAVPRGERGP